MKPLTTKRLRPQAVKKRTKAKHRFDPMNDVILATVAEVTVSLRARNDQLDEALRTLTSEFVIELMCQAERHGVADGDKRYDLAENDSRIMAARKVLANLLP